MAKMCLVHTTVPAAVQCFQCHKPICRECVIMTGGGSFCSMDCDLMNRTFKAAAKEPRRRGPILMIGILVVLLILVAGFLVVVHLMAGDEGSMRDMDLIGKILRWIRR